MPTATIKKNKSNLSSLQLINAVVLLILLSALNDPVQYRYHLTSSELGTDIDVMDDASECKHTISLQFSSRKKVCRFVFKWATGRL